MQVESEVATGVALKKSPEIDDNLKQLSLEVAARNRKWLEALMEDIAGQAQVEVSQLSEAVLLNAPDVEVIANEILAKNTVSSIIQDAAMESVAAPTFADVIDDSLQRTIVDTGFVEAFLDNFRDGMAANSVALLCAEKFAEMAVRKDVSRHVEKGMEFLAEQFETTKSLDEVFAELAESRKFDTELDEFIKMFAAHTDLSSLVAERMGEVCKSYEDFESLGQVMHDITTNTDFSQIGADVRKDLNRSYEEAVAKIVRDTEIERFRHLPYEKFLEKTFGSLPDFTLERDQQVKVDAGNSSE